MLLILEQKHQIPVSAVPCLSYKRALEEEKRLKECLEKDNKENNQQTKIIADDEEANTENKKANVDERDSSSNPIATEDSNKSGNDTTASEPPAKKFKPLGPFSNAKIETVNENLREQSLTVQQINDYCKSLFIFKHIRVMHFT